MSDVARLYDYLLNAAAEEPNKIALEFYGAQFPYDYVAGEAKKVAAGLIELGVQPNESVGVMLPNIPPFAPALYGTLLAGCVFVPMNVMLLGPEIEYLVQDSDIRVLVTLDMFIDNVNAGIKNLENPPKVFVVGENLGGHQPFTDLSGDATDFSPVETDVELPAMRLYTSGTTGKPKGAQITNANIIANIKMFESVLPPEEGDKALCVLPCFHVFALNGVLNFAVRNRSTVVLHPRFEVDACINSLMNDDITSFAAVPTMYAEMLKNPMIDGAKFPKLRHCVSGGAAMPIEVMSKWEDLSGAPVYEGYGLTETTVSVSINTPEERKIGSIGKPFDAVEMKIVDDNGKDVADGEMGEIVIKGPNVMLGYLNKPEANKEALRNGWFHTGDIGYRDEDGFFFIADRKKDMIIKGGFNIYPREIEEIIYQRPEVAEAAVVGFLDEVKGELVRAVIALKPGKELSQEDLHSHLAANLAKYKLPNDYIFLPELPKGPTGKILKRELRSQWDQWNKDRVKPAGSEASAVSSK